MKFYELREARGIGSLTLRDGDTPHPGNGQVLIRVRAVSLNYRDLSIACGRYRLGLKLPLVPMSDGAGEVVEVGSGVHRFKAGDRVMGIFMQSWLAGEMRPAYAGSALGGSLDGMASEYVVLNEQGIVPVPPHLSYEEAATLPCAGVTAWHALTSQGLHPGMTVLVLGTGGVSMFALQFAILSGARVIVTSSSDAKLVRARDLGAAEGINYTSTPEWDRRVLELTDGAGVDHVVEVGGAGTLERSVNAVRIGGRVSLIGVLTGFDARVNPMGVLGRQVELHGVFVGSRAMFESMNTAIALHGLRPVIDRVFRFDEAADALRFMEARRHFGKIVLAGC